MAVPNGVVLLCQRKFDEVTEVLEDMEVVKLVVPVAPHIGATFSGLLADFRAILSFCREEAVKYETTYFEKIPVRMLTKLVAAEFQEKTQQGGVRPYGLSLFLCGYDVKDNEDGQGLQLLPSLY